MPNVTAKVEPKDKIQELLVPSAMALRTSNRANVFGVSGTGFTGLR